MPFTGKATYTAGASLPEIAEDVSDLVSLSSPVETPLLDALGDAPRAAHSTVHEWLEDALVPNTDVIVSVDTATQYTMAHADRFRVGDQLNIEGQPELMLVTGVDLAGGQITVERNYGGTVGGTVATDVVL